jgi:hypothetical protein
LLLLVVLAAACLVSTAPAAPAPLASTSVPLASVPPESVRPTPAPLASVPPASMPPVSVPPTPPALLALEQKLAQIRFNTARVGERFVIGDLGSTAGGAELGSGVDNSLVTIGAGSIRYAPYASTITNHVEAFGKQLSGAQAGAVQVRTVGATSYSYMPSVASFDGGRPWVRSTRTPPPKPGTNAAQAAALLDSLAPTLPSSRTGSAAPFATLIGYLNGAVSVSEGGSVAVDGQQTTEFTAYLSIVKLLAGKVSPKQLAKIESEALGKPSEATVELEVFIAPDGLPVRTIGVSGNHTEGLGIQQDILALEVPFAIHAPPARETIAQARLLQIERKRAREQLAKARARCLRSAHGRACAVRAPAAGHSGVSGRSVAPRSLR